LRTLEFGNGARAFVIVSAFPVGAGFEATNRETVFNGIYAHSLFVAEAQATAPAATRKNKIPIQPAGVENKLIKSPETDPAVAGAGEPNRESSELESSGPSLDVFAPLPHPQGIASALSQCSPEKQPKAD